MISEAERPEPQDHIDVKRTDVLSRLRHGFEQTLGRVLYISSLAVLLNLLWMGSVTTFSALIPPQLWSQSSLVLSVKSCSAKSVFIIPFSAPHLNRSQLKSQTRLMRRAINKRRAFTPVSRRVTRRTLKRRQGLLKKLQRPSKIQDEVRRACRSAKGYYALSVYMTLGTDTRPAKLNGSIFFCRDALRKLERFELPFEGRLTKQVWRIFAEEAEEALSRPPSRRPLLSIAEESQDRRSRPSSRSDFMPQRRTSRVASMTPPQPRPRPQPLSPLTRPSPRLNSSDSRLNSSDSRLNSSDSRLNSSDPRLNQTGQSRSQPLETPRLSLWFGGRVFVRDFLYSTSPDSALLQGGIRYSSGWLPGWGGRFSLRPFSPKTRSFLSRISLLGEFEMYQFDSLYVIPDPFGKDGEERLPSNLVRWAAGVRFSHGLSGSRRAHIIGLELKYRSLDLNLSDNPHYLGVEYAIFELNLIGALVLIPRTLWLDISGGVQPWVDLVGTVDEVGETSQNIGASTKMGVRYRADGGLSLGMHLGIDFIFYDAQGEGRNGRVGESARDQIISINIDLGWMSQIDHSKNLSEMIQSGTGTSSPRPPVMRRRGF